MRILHVTSDWKWTGPAEPMLHSIRGLRELGYPVDLACPERPPHETGSTLEFAVERGVEPVLVLNRGRGYQPLRDRGEVKRLRALVNDGGYDVVHAHHTRDHLMLRAALSDPGRRLVASWHQGEAIPDRFWNRWLFSPRRLAGLVVLSSEIAARAQADLKLSSSRLAIAPGVVDTERFSPLSGGSLRDELGLKPHDRVIGVVARLQPHRQIGLLLEALRRALEQEPALKLVVIGRGSHQREVLDEPVERLGLASSVIRAGYRAADYLQVLECMNALAFLVPGSDGSCRAVLEAMSMATPVIASRRGILPHLIANGETGRVVDEDPDELAGVFLDVARDPKLWRARGHQARQRALEHHSIPTHARRLSALYSALSHP